MKIRNALGRLILKRTPDTRAIAGWSDESQRLKQRIIWSAGVLAFLFAPVATLALESGSLTDARPSQEPPWKMPATPSEFVPEQAPLQQPVADKSSLHVEQTISSTSDDSGANVNITVNGQPVNVPPTGNTNQQIISDDGRTIVNVKTENVQSDTNGVTSSNSNVHITSQTQSSSSGDVP